MSVSVTPEQIARAKAVDIFDYLQRNEPDNLRLVGREYRLRDHNSLTISNGLWHWHSRGIGGKNVVDYLIKVRDYDFVEAVLHIINETPAIHTSHSASAPLPPPKPFALPPRHCDNERVIAYLYSRGIDKPLIRECIERGILYESARYHNCVFVGRDERGKAKFAAMRGTRDDFKCDADGSDKRFGFVLPPDFAKPNHSINSSRLMVFESPIDALSHKALHPHVNGWRLSLGGTALMAMMQFLEMHPEISRIVACTDNDEAGNDAAEKIRDTVEGFGLKYDRTLPDSGNDWNEALQIQRNEERFMEDARKDILFLKEPFTYPEAFRIKDGESVKVTFAYDGSEDVQKCRWIDEVHLYFGNSAYHISELAERLQKNGNKVEPIIGQKPMLDIVAAKYGEVLQDTAIPMTNAALRKLVGGAYELTPLTYSNGTVYAMRVDGPDGVAICGISDETLTSLHPYHAQDCKRKLSPVERPAVEAPAIKPSLLGQLNEAKAAAAEQKNTAEKPKNRGASERS